MLPTPNNDNETGLDRRAIASPRPPHSPPVAVKLIGCPHQVDVGTDNSPLADFELQMHLIRDSRRGQGFA